MGGLFRNEIVFFWLSYETKTTIICRKFSVLDITKLFRLCLVSVPYKQIINHYPKIKIKTRYSCKRPIATTPIEIHKWRLIWLIKPVCPSFLYCVVGTCIKSYLQQILFESNSVVWPNTYYSLYKSTSRTSPDKKQNYK